MMTDERYLTFYDWCRGYLPSDDSCECYCDCESAIDDGHNCCEDKWPACHRELPTAEAYRAAILEYA